MEEAPPGHVAVGHVATAWGVGGVLKVNPLVDKRERLARGRSVDLAGQTRTIETSRWHKGHVYLKLSGIDDRESAFALRDRLLTIPESELDPLPEGQYYRFQLIGLAVTTTAGQPLGEVADVIATGANDVYVVRGQRGEVLVPATAEVVREIDIGAGRMLIEEIPGLLPDAGGQG
ncbi:MAG: ribosome maturation factor RimM [Dehalococcoidia bacterium]